MKGKKFALTGIFLGYLNAFADPAPHRAREIFHRGMVPFAFLIKPFGSGLSHSK